MSWICPKCNRTFRSKNQDHSCLILGPDYHFSGKPDKIKKIFDNVLSAIEEQGEVQISYVKHAIIISAKSSFLAFKPKKHLMDIEIVLSEEVNEFPVYKTVRASKNKFAHFIKVEEPEEVDLSLKKLVIKAWKENTGRF
jgi:Domain of unknown function (DUF5655)